MKLSTKKKTTIPASIGIGMLASITATMIGVALVAFLISAEQMEVKNMGVGVVMILILSSAAGTWLSIRQAGEQPLVVGLASAAGYFCILLSGTALFFGGQYAGVAVTGVAILGGSLSAVLSSLRSRGQKRKKRYRIR